MDALLICHLIKHDKLHSLLLVNEIKVVEYDLV